MVDFDILANENLKNLQHLDISDNPLKGFKSLNQCPNHSLTMHIDTLKNLTILEELETSQCFANDYNFPGIKIELTGSETEKPIACDNWCEFSEILQRNIIIDTTCNCTEVTGVDENVTSATSSGASPGTTSSGLKKVFFVILFLIFLLVMRYHWKTIRSFWFKLRNKNHSDHESLLTDNRVTYRRNLSSMYSMLPEEHGDSDLDDEGTGDSPTPNEIDFD